MQDLKSTWKNALKDSQETLSRFLESEELLDQCQKLSAMMIECFENGGKLMVCGNGGSHCDAMHCAEELTGRYRKDRRPLPAMAFGDPSHTSCVANDYGFEEVFRRQAEAFAQPGDVLIGISTSGNSENVIRACHTAKLKGAKTILLGGKDGGKLKDLCDLAIVVPSDITDRIQEIHIKIIHTMIESIERSLFPENY